MKVRAMRFPRRMATVVNNPKVSVKFKEVEPGNGFIVEVPDATPSTLQQAYRCIKKGIATRQNEKYRIIWLLNSFLVYRCK